MAAARRLMDIQPEGPRRTVRLVLFGAEEVGLLGAAAYARAYADSLEDHIIASESDFGAGRIWRFETGVGEHRIEAARSLGAGVRVLGAVNGDNTASGGDRYR